MFFLNQAIRLSDQVIRRALRWNPKILMTFCQERLRRRTLRWLRPRLVPHSMNFRLKGRCRLEATVDPTRIRGCVPQDDGTSEGLSSIWALWSERSFVGKGSCNRADDAHFQKQVSNEFVKTR